MWHEARRQEKKIRGLMVDYKKRAERRREFYEKIKLDPTQFLRVYGRPYKIHLDQAVAMAAESPQSMMPWQGNRDNMIDRFDVRAHLDTIPEIKKTEPITLNRGEDNEERQANYERYRTLVESESAGLTEEQALHQIYIDEQFGPPDRTAEEEKKKLVDKKAAIGYTYEDSTAAGDEDEDEDGEESDESSDTDVETADLDVTLDVDELTVEQMVLINQCAEAYGMKQDDFIRLLRKDKEELEALRQAKLLEEEKAQFAGRKSRRERRAFKDKRLQGRRVSPPSYAARDSPKYEPYRRSSSSSKSRSRSPENVGKVMFITCFGDDSDHEGKNIVVGPSLPTNHQHQSRTHSDKSDSKRQPCSKKSSSRKHRSRTRSRSRSRSRSWNRNNRRRRTPSRSPSYSRSRRYSRERRPLSRDRKSYPRSSPRRYMDRRRYGERYRPRSRSRSRSRSPRRRSRSTSKSSARSRSSRSSSLSSSSSRSRSRSKSKSRSRSKSHSRSRSRSPVRVVPVTQPVKRYRRKSLSSNESKSDDEDDNDKRSSTSYGHNRPTQPIVFSKRAVFNQMKLTPQERLKRKMQAQLNKQYKADKKAETMRISKVEQERMDREEDLRSRAMEMRRREREKRHKEMEERERNATYNSDSDSSRSPSRSPRRSRRDRSRTRSRSRSISRSRSRSRSRSMSPARGLVSY